MLAIDVNDDAGCLIQRGALESIASMLAPTGFCVNPALWHTTEPCRSELARDGR
jgi:hypothetical protein